MSRGRPDLPPMAFRKSFARTLVRSVPFAAVVVVAASCGDASGQSAGPVAARPCGGAAATSVTATSSNYVMTMVAGPLEKTYSQAEVSNQHPTSGEMMLRGQMTMPGDGAGSGMPGASMSGSAAGQVRHLEVHICTLSGTVVSDANPSIRLHDTTAGTAVNVPVAMMQGVMAGASDLHYGNNISMTPGHSYSAEVMLNGAAATFQIPAP